METFYTMKAPTSTRIRLFLARGPPGSATRPRGPSPTLPHHTCSHIQVEDSPVGTIFRGNLRADAGAPSHRTAKRSPLPSRHTSAETAIGPPAFFPMHLPAIARKLDRMPATLPRRCGLLEGAGEARQRIEEPTGRGPRRGAAAAHRGPVAPHSGAARGYAARFEPCVLVPALPCAWFPPSGSLAVGVGPRLCAGIAVTATLCAAVRRSGRREGAGVSGARPEGGKDAAVGRGLGSGPLLSLGVLVHRPWLRPLLLQYATPPLPSASRRTPHKLQ